MQELFSLSLAVWELPSAAQKKRTFLTFVLQAGKLTSQRLRWRVPCRASALLKAAPLDERVSLSSARRPIFSWLIFQPTALVSWLTFQPTESSPRIFPSETILFLTKLKVQSFYFVALVNKLCFPFVKTTLSQTHFRVQGLGSRVLGSGFRV